MNEADKIEHASLAEQVDKLERLLNSGTTGNVGVLLRAFVSNAKARMDELQGDMDKADLQKREETARQNAGIAALVEREHRLNAEEKHQYGEFLKQDYFTKANFEELEKFYANTWDKLSEEGKTQMSHRVWEGIRRDEFTFNELPEAVRKKEADRLHQQLTGQIAPDSNHQNIPEKDRQEFIKAYESKDDKAMSEVLSRENVSRHVGKSASKEADYIKEKEPAEKVQKNEEQSIVLDDVSAARNPTELQITGGSVRTL